MTEVQARCSTVVGSDVLVELPDEDEPARVPVEAVAAELGIRVRDVPGKRVLVTVTETPETGRVLSGFRLHS
jgi:hypothetical protein